MLEQMDAVIFDLDGTLMDSMWVWPEIDVGYLARYGQTLPENLQDDIAGMSFTETAGYFKKRFQIPETIEEIKADWNRLAFGKYAREVRLKSGAAGFLREARRRGLKIAIASSNSRELIMACLENNGVAELFDHVVTACDVSKGKPAPDIYLRAAEALDVAPGRCLVFEDIPEGILAGQRAGMKVCAVEDSFAVNQTEKIRGMADYYIRSYDEICGGTYETL